MDFVEAGGGEFSKNMIPLILALLLTETKLLSLLQTTNQTHDGLLFTYVIITAHLIFTYYLYIFL